MINVPNISDADAAFPTERVLSSWVPPMSSIPEEFRGGMGRWSLFFVACFYYGAKLNTKRMGLMPKEGVNAGKAWKALQALIGSYALRHEHKEAAFAFLASEWFSDVRWERLDTGEIVPFENTELELAWLEKHGGV